MVADALIEGLLRDYGNLRAVANVIGIEHPVLRAIVRRKPHINKKAQQLQQNKFRKPTEFSLKRLLRRDLCSYCGIHPSETPDGRMTIDHVVPRAIGGDNNLSNMAGSCYSCNQAKASRDLLGFLLDHNSKENLCMT